MYTQYQVAVTAGEANCVRIRPVGWLDALLRLEEFQAQRRDRREGMLAAAQFMSEKAIGFTTAPTVAGLATATGLTQRTIYRYLNLLRRWGLLVVLEHGSTPSTRSRAAVLDTEGNRASVYIFTVPGQRSVESSTRHMRTGSSSGSSPRGVNVSPSVKIYRSSRDHLSRAREEDLSQDWVGPARTGEQRLWQARSLKRHIQELVHVSDRALRSVLRSFQRAGWILQDFLDAWGHQPGPDGLPGTAWGATQVRRAEGLLAYRLGLWRDAQGTVLPSPATVFHHLRAHEKATQAERRAEWDEQSSLAQPMSDTLLRTLSEIAASAQVPATSPRAASVEPAVAGNLGEVFAKCRQTWDVAAHQTGDQPG